MTMVFDEAFYSSGNADVRAAVESGIITDGLWHYDNFGWDEGRDPNAYFDTSYYLDNNSDVANSLQGLENGAMSPLQHFQSWGAAEARNPNAKWEAFDLHSFDEEFYLNGNDDVAAAVEGGVFSNGLHHFMCFGFFEGREGRLLDGTIITLDAQNPDLGQTFVLTASQLEYEGTDGDDTYTGDSDGLQQETSIDAKEGDDSLVLDLEDDFDGFDEDAGLTDLENIILTNKDDGSLVFNAKGIHGVTHWTINAAEDDVTLGSLEELPAITISLADKEFTVSFLENVLQGSDDSLNLQLKQVGDGSSPGTITIAAPAGETLETLVLDTLTHPDENWMHDVLLVGERISQLIARGGGGLELETVLEDMRSFDGSALTGNIIADFTNANDIRSILGGAGDDSFILQNVDPGALLSGGQGDNTLTFEKLSGGAYRFDLAGFDDMILDDTEETVTIYNRDFENLQEFTVRGELGGDVRFLELGGDDVQLTIDEHDATAAQTNAVLCDTTGNVEVRLVDSHEDSESQGFQGDIMVHHADEVLIANESEGHYTSADLFAGAAEVVNIQSLGDGNIDIAKAYLAEAREMNFFMEENGDITIDTFSSGLNQLARLTLEGIGNADLNDAPLPGLTSLETVDASELHGDFDIDLSNAEDDLAITGSPTGDNDIIAGEGNDTIIGGAGDDTIRGGRGSDKLRLEEGRDEARYRASDSAELHEEGGDTGDVISEFTSGEDVISFDYEALTGFDADDVGSAALNSVLDLLGVGNKNIVQANVNEIETAMTTDASDAEDVISFLDDEGIEMIGSLLVTLVSSIFTVNDGEDSYIWHALANGNVLGFELDTDDIKLLGVVEGVNDFSAGDFEIF